MSPIWPLLWNGFRETRRNRVTVVVFLFAFVMIFSASFALEVTVATLDRVITDIGLGLMALISTFLAIFLASGLIPREIERRTIFMVVSRPVSRSAFVVGRLLGNLVTVAFVTVVMSVLFFAQLVLTRSDVTTAQLVAIYGIGLQVILISAVGFLFAAAAHQFAAAVGSVGLYFIGHLASDLYRLSNRPKSSEVVRVMGTALYYVLPNLDRLDFKGRATYADPTSLAELASATAYTLGYSLLLVILACVIFQRRDFK